MPGINQDDKQDAPKEITCAGSVKVRLPGVKNG